MFDTSALFKRYLAESGQEQVARLLDSVYEIPDDEKALYGFSLSPDQATHVENTFPSLHLMWDERFHCYTFDGLVLSRNPQPVYRREIWQPDSSKKDFKIIVERSTKHSVILTVTGSYLQDDEWNNGLIRVFDPTSIEKSIQNFDLQKLKTSSGWSSSATVLLGAGNSIVFELKGKQRTIKSPVFIP